MFWLVSSMIEEWMEPEVRDWKVKREREERSTKKREIRRYLIKKWKITWRLVRNRNRNTRRESESTNFVIKSEKATLTQFEARLRTEESNTSGRNVVSNGKNVVLSGIGKFESPMDWSESLHGSLATELLNRTIFIGEIIRNKVTTNRSHRIRSTRVYNDVGTTVVCR